MKIIIAAILAFMTLPTLCDAGPVVRAVHGTVDSLGSAGKTVVVKTADGAKYTLHAAATTAVYGLGGTAAGAKAAFTGITVGTEVVAHYTKEGAKYTAISVGAVGGAGLRATEGTVKAIDRGARTVAVKTADGSVQVFSLAAHATAAASKSTAKAVTTGAKVVVYSTETAGRKMAHLVRAL